MTVAPERMPFVNGIHMAAGGLGALAGGAPAEYAIAAFGWRSLFLGLAALSLLAAVLIAVFGPPSRGATRNDRIHEQMRAVGRILTDPLFLSVAAFCVPSQATALAIQGLWAGPWLRDVQGLDSATAATVLSLMAAAMIFGFLILGSLSARAAARGIPMFRSAVAGMIAFMLVQAALIVSPTSAGTALWCLYAFFATSGILLFPALAASYPREMAGRVNTALNFLVFTSSFAIQWLVGVALDVLSPALGTGGTFKVVFAVLLITQAAGLMVMFVRVLRKEAA